MPEIKWTKADHERQARSLVRQVEEQRDEIERLQELAATATRAHTRAIHALVGNCEYPQSERREMGAYLTQELQRGLAFRERQADD